MNTTENIFHQETIIAQCTPQGRGALALLRLSGNDALQIASNLCRLASRKRLDEVSSHTVHAGWIVDQNNNHIDQVMFIVMHAPRTFTGEHVVEITCHNNQFIIEAIVQRVLACGARIAQEGEFAKRAYLNKKIDLVQAEAINELIHANTQQALKQSLAQLEGSLSHHITRLEQEIYKALALSEASFEFLDEEIDFGIQIKHLIESLLKEINILKQNFDQQQHIRQGIRIALIGSVNAGKSSIFNALLGKNRAIVTDIAGTTRDVIEAGVYRDGTYWTLVDTAGLRETNDVIEQEGIKRSLHEAQLADIILLVYDHSKQLGQHEIEIYTDIAHRYAHKILIVKSKADLLPSGEELCLPSDSAHLDTSVHQQSTVCQLEAGIKSKIEAILSNAQAPFLLNQRQFNLILGLEKKLCALLPMLQEHIPYELVSYHLKEALADFAELTGKSITDQGMDTIFRTFCIGK